MDKLTWSRRILWTPMNHLPSSRGALVTTTLIKKRSKWRASFSSSRTLSTLKPMKREARQLWWQTRVSNSMQDQIPLMTKVEEDCLWSHLFSPLLILSRFMETNSKQLRSSLLANPSSTFQSLTCKPKSHRRSWMEVRTTPRFRRTSRRKLNLTLPLKSCSSARS